MSKIHAALLLTVVTAASVGAQAPDGRAGPTGRGAPAAQLLLAHTGELELTDQQVVRLAAIARRAEARRRSMRASMDSARARFGPGRATPGDSVARRQLRDRMRTDMTRMRDQHRADQRDAIAVLSTDQQARAWELVAARGGRAMRERGMHGGRGEREFRGRRPMPRPPREG